jgi:hypothetical protein
MEVHKNPIFKVSDIPTVINGVNLSQQDIEKLSYGESSGLLTNMMFNDGELLDGKVWLSRDEAGQLEIKYMFSRPNISIPKQIEDFVISEKDRLRLMNNEIAGPFLFRGQHIFLQVDHDLNRIVVKSGYEINVPTKIGEYALTAEDMNILANGGKMKNRLFCINGKYYTAETGMTADKRGLFFDNYKDQNHLSKNQLKDLERSLNQPSASVPLFDLSSNLEALSALKKTEFAKYLLDQADNKRSVDGGISQQQEIFRDAVDNYDMNMLVHLKQSGFTPDVSDVDYIKNNINLDDEEKNMIGTVLEVNLKEVTYNEHNRPDHVSHIQQSVIKYENRTGLTEIQTQPSNQSVDTEKHHFKNPGASVELEQKEENPHTSAESVTAQRVGNMVTEAFNNM